MNNNNTKLRARSRRVMFLLGISDLHGTSYQITHVRVRQNAWRFGPWSSFLSVPNIGELDFGMRILWEGK
jgi:hypothetical protein